MKLPIDNFQILGVGIGTDARTILTILERRMEKSRFEGFSKEALQRRKVILIESSQVLLDPEMRKKYEETYTEKNEKNVDKGIEVEQNNKIAALILLLEAGQAEETLTLAKREIDSWRTPVSDGGNSYRDLTLIMDYATLDYAEKLSAGRYYEASAEIIRKRLEDNDMPVLSNENKIQMKEEIKRLLPYRVLDMISRQNDERVRKTGIDLLEKLVHERGGLDSQSDLYMSQKEFVAFFHQIREYLTVQEQIELFTKWGGDGSKVSSFLAGISLVASGFAQRKAEKVNAALTTMQGIKREELEPIIANIHLLLGDIRTAEKVFDRNADDALKEWTKEQSSDKLGQLCIWCEEWLNRDVLPGYRDIRVDANLEAYFGDKDVTAYLEGLTDLCGAQGHESKETTYRDSKPGKVGQKATYRPVEETALLKKKKWMQRVGTNIRYKSKNLREGTNEKMIILGTIAASILSLTLFSYFSLHKNKEIGNEKTKKANVLMDNANKLNDVEAENLKSILSKYIEIKKEVLMGGSIPANAKEYLSIQAIQRMEEEYKGNKLKGVKQEISVEIKDLKVVESKKDAKKVLTRLRYSDKTLDTNGKEIAKTPVHDFYRYYKLISNGNRWLVN